MSSYYYLRALTLLYKLEKEARTSQENNVCVCVCVCVCVFVCVVIGDQRGPSRLLAMDLASSYCCISCILILLCI